MIRIYTDGAASGNPGPGGYGVVLKYKDAVKELSGGFRLTTNNRMELLAVIIGLEAITKPGIAITIFSDSKYVVDAIEKKWVWGWQAKNFKDKANKDLWLRYLPLHARYNPKYTWIRGHAGHPENERCDQLAVRASQGYDLPADSGYEAKN
jgi:ribonuclease HI